LISTFAHLNKNMPMPEKAKPISAQTGTDMRLMPRPSQMPQSVAAPAMQVLINHTVTQRPMKRRLSEYMNYSLLMLLSPAHIEEFEGNAPAVYHTY
jgi:hypothetical protein